MCLAPSPGFCTQICLDLSNYSGQIRQALLGRKILQVLRGHVRRGVGFAVETVLDVHEQGIIFLRQVPQIHAGREA